MAKITVDVQPRGIASAYINLPFDEGQETLQKQGYPIISLEDNAQLRIQEGKEADVSRNGNWVREGVLYVPKKGIFLTKKSPILANAREATQCHRQGQDYYLTDEQVEQALDGAMEITVTSIPVHDLHNHPSTAYGFGNNAKAYGEFLTEAKIKKSANYLPL